MRIFLLYTRTKDTWGDGTVLSAHWTKRLAEQAAERSARATALDMIQRFGMSTGDVCVTTVPRQGKPSESNWIVASRRGDVCMTFFVVGIEVEGSAIDMLAELA